MIDVTDTDDNIIASCQTMLATLATSTNNIQENQSDSKIIIKNTARQQQQQQSSTIESTNAIGDGLSTPTIISIMLIIIIVVYWLITKLFLKIFQIFF